jgi:hypothetical protein
MPLLGWIMVLDLPLGLVAFFWLLCRGIKRVWNETERLKKLNPVRRANPFPALAPALIALFAVFVVFVIRVIGAP